MQKIFLKLKGINKFIFVTVITVIILAAGFVFVALQTEESPDAAKEVKDLATNIRRYYQNKPDFWGLSTKTVLDKKICPNRMLQNGKLVGFFGNPVLVGSGPDAMVLMPGARNFDIIYKDLSKKQCVALATSRFESDFWLGVVGVSIADVDKQQRFDWDNKEFSLPIKKALAKRFCASDSMVIWHFEQ